MNQEKRRVVITGMGTINPLGHDVATTWRQTAVGQSGIGPITQFDAREYKTQFAGEVKEFDPAELFGRKEARRMDRVTQFALAAAGQALAQAQLTVSDANRQRIGVMMGSGMGIMQPIIESQGVLQERGAGRPHHGPAHRPAGAGDLPLRADFAGTPRPHPGGAAQGSGAVSRRHPCPARRRGRPRGHDPAAVRRQHEAGQCG